MTNETYQGWSNYETWSVNLWLSSDEGSYRHWSSMAEETYENAEENRYHSRSQSARYALATMLRDEVDESNPLTDGSMFSDLLSSALSEVNWYEVANAFLESVDGYQSE